MCGVLQCFLPTNRIEQDEQLTNSSTPEQSLKVTKSKFIEKIHHPQGKGCKAFVYTLQFSYVALIISFCNPLELILSKNLRYRSWKLGSILALPTMYCRC
jgi:hypothetical protein